MVEHCSVEAWQSLFSYRPTVNVTDIVVMCTWILYIKIRGCVAYLKVGVQIPGERYRARKILSVPLIGGYKIPNLGYMCVL